MQFLYFCILLFVLGFFIFKLPSHQRNKKILQLFTWCGIILGVVFLYSIKDVVLNNNFVASLIPSYGYAPDKKTLIFKKANDGHFYISAKINGQSVRFLVDTGASDIALTRSDAIKIGINIKRLNYTKIYNTANGQIYAAPVVVLEDFFIKDIKIHNVKASVFSSDALGQSLLGMAFLEDFTFSISDETLTITF